MHQNEVLWVYKPSTWLLSNLPNTHRPSPSVVYHLQSFKKPYHHCLPFIATTNSLDYYLPSATISCTLQTSISKYSLFLLPYTSCYLIVVANNFLPPKIKNLTYILTLVKEMQNNFTKCNTLCKFKLHYLLHSSIR